MGPIVIEVTRLGRVSLAAQACDIIGGPVPVAFVNGLIASVNAALAEAADISNAASTQAVLSISAGEIVLSAANGDLANVA